MRLRGAHGAARARAWAASGPWLPKSEVPYIDYSFVQTFHTDVTNVTLFTHIEKSNLAIAKSISQLSTIEKNRDLTHYHTEVLSGQ